MPALRIFDPYVFLANESRTAIADKAAKPVAPEDETLATLAALAGGHPITPISTPDAALVSPQTNPIDIIDVFADKGASPENEVSTPTPAKVAKVAKVKAGGDDAAALAALSPEIEIPAVWADSQEERAAIAQYDGGVPRAWAEGFARLDPDNPPADVPPKRWVRFIDDVGAFLDSPFCAVAAALSWGPFDLFGCDRDAPFARIDCAGLLWLLDGDRLVMLAADAATIETQTGVRRTWRRKPCRDDLVLAWELAS